MQSSAEYRALSLQAFNVARDRVDMELAERDPAARPAAVIVDVDETVLDNTAYGAWMLREQCEYESATWDAWVQAREATPVAGAKAFLDYAASCNVEVFYVTNRRAELDSFTLASLQAAEFPFADAAHLLSKSDTHDKTLRRDRIAASHDVLLLLGDNLGDFDQVFQGALTDGGGSSSAPLCEQRTTAVDAYGDDFGRRFIVLPNPTYGRWEDAIFDDRRDLDAAAKRQRRDAALRVWLGPR